MTKEDELTAGLRAELARVNARLAVQDAIVGGTGVLLDGKRIDPASIYAEPAPVQEPVAKRYCCHSCFKASGGVMLDRMILCSECGNKRCPKASDHNFSCTGSNEPGQWGSIYTTPPAAQPVPVKTYHDGKPWPVAPKPVTGCACRWDHDDNRVATCERHQGWLDVIAEWADRARAAEAKLREKNGGAA